MLYSYLCFYFTGAEEVNRTPDLLITNLRMTFLFSLVYSIRYVPFLQSLFFCCRQTVT